MAGTAEYYRSNPEARRKRLKQQAKYNKTKKGQIYVLTQIDLTTNLEPTGMVTAKMLLTTKGVPRKEDSNLHLRTEKADSKYVNDPFTT